MAMEDVDGLNDSPGASTRSSTANTRRVSSVAINVDADRSGGTGRDGSQ
jgi:hypothetical protein